MSLRTADPIAELDSFLREVGRMPDSSLPPGSPEWVECRARVRAWCAQQPGRREWLGLPPAEER